MIEPPNSPRTEAAAALAKGALSAIPIVGGVVSEVGNLYFNPVERRKQQWMKDISEAVNTIGNRFALLPEDLEHNESFISFLYQATICALKNHRREKLDALRSAIIASVDTGRFPEDTALQFLRYIDELTVTHLALLSQLSAQEARLASTRSLEELYNIVCPALRSPIERSAFRLFLYELDARSLVRLGDIEDFPEYASKRSYLEVESSAPSPFGLTPLGQSFLAFLSA